jgi:formylglycine-generating enzyme
VKASASTELHATEVRSAMRDSIIELPGGSFAMGSDDGLAYPGDGEGPVRTVEVAAFGIDSVCVTNQRFAEFIRATGYVTDAERFGNSFVFGGLLPEDFPPTRAVVAAPWWREILGADWAHPEGPQSEVRDRADHPVVHVSWTDANAYCDWVGLRLPTEAEWEYAARGGLVGQPFPWGDEREPGGEHRMNVWQGTFPNVNTLDDGYLGTAEVTAFPPNDFGLYNTTGNVWEWTADAWATPDRKALRGGSYLCHESYCRRYRVSARMGNTIDSTSGNTGFRVAVGPL